MAKIIGNTTATPNPRPDWAQNDPTKADYIKNKPTNLMQSVTASITNGVLMLTQVGTYVASVVNKVLMFVQQGSATTSIVDNVLVAEQNGTDYVASIVDNKFVVMWGG